MEESTINHKLWQICQVLQDRLILYRRSRWISLLSLIILYAFRLVLGGSYYVVTYCTAIFFLNQFLLFLTPLNADTEDEFSDNPVLPIHSQGEFSPFMRKLGEFKLWRNLFLGMAVAVICTFIPSLNVPVAMPVLVIYFIVLFIITMRKQIGHMMKHGYIPFDLGKQKYQPEGKS